MSEGAAYVIAIECDGFPYDPISVLDLLRGEAVSVHSTASRPNELCVSLQSFVDEKLSDGRGPWIRLLESLSLHGNHGVRIDAPGWFFTDETLVNLAGVMCASSRSTPIWIPNPRFRDPDLLLRLLDLGPLFGAEGPLDSRWRSI
jgi:hypothetical protein